MKTFNKSKLIKKIRILQAMASWCVPLETQWGHREKPTAHLSGEELAAPVEFSPARGIQGKSGEFIIAFRTIIPEDFLSCYEVMPLLALHLLVRNATSAVTHIVLTQHTSCRWRKPTGQGMDKMLRRNGQIWLHQYLKLLYRKLDDKVDKIG